MAQAGHIHNIELEGPLPEGFPNEGLLGKVRNVYEEAGRICLIASDRVSAFDQVSPTPIPGKGVLLNSIAARELSSAEAAGIPTWFEEVPSENPRAAIGKAGDILPVEMIFRNYMTGSMWREYRDHGDFAGFGLPSGMTEWADFSSEPLFTPSTKSDEKDVNFHPSAVEEMTGIEAADLTRMEELCRKLFTLGTHRAAERGLILVDTKYEVGLDDQGGLMILDEVHTPDSSRFVYRDGFAAAVEAGEAPKSLSKEFLRQIMIAKAGGDLALAKELMKAPLPTDVVEETRARYEELQRTFVGE